MRDIRNLQFDVDEKGALLLFADGFQPVLHKHADFWRMHLDDGENREIEVCSSAQTPHSVKKDKDKITVEYRELTDEFGMRHQVLLTIYIKNIGGAMYFSADVENRADVRINEFQIPVVDFERISSEPEQEVFYVPDGLGMRYPNPRKFIEEKCHTEYMTADYKNIWYTATYPHSIGAMGALSMPWIGVQSGKYFVYLGKHDEIFRVLNFCVGTGARNTVSRLLMTIGQYPALQKGEKMHFGDCIIAVFDGDWRDGARFYKNWAESTWYRREICPDWVRNMTGWQRIILKHQYGEIFFRYDDLPRIYENGKRHGINTLLVFGWWKGCFDNGYPEYEADPALGGEEGLKKAIDDVHSLGGRVLLYSNGNLIDVKTNYYQETGRQICSKDIGGNEYREHYRFANNGSLLRTFGYKSFVTGCHGTNQWRQKLLETGRLKLGFQPDSIFYDQLCCCVKLCFDQTHLHKNRIDLEPHYRSINVDSIKELLGEGQAMGTEWVADRFTTKVHYTHGCGNGMTFSEFAYPDLFRHTFPECVISNRLIHDEKEDFKDHLNYAFVSGLIFDVAVNRCRKTDISGYPKYGEYLGYLLNLKEKYHEFFYEGQFVSAYDLDLPDNVRAARYVNGSRSITAMWNNSPNTVCIKVYGKNIEVPEKSVMVVEGY